MTVRGKKVGQGGSLVGLAGLVLDIIEKTVILGTPGHNISWSDTVTVRYQMVNAIGQVSPV